MKGEETSVGNSCVLDTLDKARERKGRGGDEGGAAKGGRRESVRCECGPPMAREPTKVPLVPYFGIKAKQPLLDVTHEAASAHPGVPDYVRTRLHVVGARRSQETAREARDCRIFSASFAQDA